jgi:hypothetical protein
MSQVKITITLDLPPDARVTVGDGAPDEVVPIPGTTPVATNQATQVAGPKQLCPIHGVSKWVPGGVSRTKFDANGQPAAYNGFWACTERSCTAMKGR